MTGIAIVITHTYTYLETLTQASHYCDPRAMQASHYCDPRAMSQYVNLVLIFGYQATNTRFFYALWFPSNMKINTHVTNCYIKFIIL